MPGGSGASIRRGIPRVASASLRMAAFHRDRRGHVAPSACCVTAALLLSLAAFGAAQKFQSDFSSAEVGKVPADMQAVTGGYAVVEVGGNKLLELPGDPLESFGLLFGPADRAEPDVRAKAWGESSGRRFPEFGVGTGDVAGYRLMLLPAQKKLELRRGEHKLTSAETLQPWRSGTWTWLRLRVSRQGNDRWAIEGKAWPADGGEPQAWQIRHEASEPPQAGRASVWAVPFSGRPIRFDDLAVE